MAGQPTHSAEDVLAGCGHFERVRTAPAYFREVAKRSTDACESLAQVADDARAGKSAELRKALKDAWKAVDKIRTSLRPLLVQNKSLPTAGGIARESRVEPTLTHAIDDLTNTKAQVRCFSPDDWSYVVDERLAVYGLPEVDYLSFSDWGNLYLSDEEGCHSFAEFIYRKRWNVPLYDAVFDVDGLASLAEYLRTPRATLATLACRAMQDIDPLVRLMHGSKRQAREFARIYWQQDYGMHGPQYFSPECRPNGPLDRTPRDGVWP